eukprot:m.31790 g.31790  ORF g.31790 m.31790 type:complete len:230 (-) comp5404_c0_seq2:3331-4020(-)
MATAMQLCRDAVLAWGTVSYFKLRWARWLLPLDDLGPAGRAQIQAYHLLMWLAALRSRSASSASQLPRTLLQRFAAARAVPLLGLALLDEALLASLLVSHTRSIALAGSIAPPSDTPRDCCICCDPTSTLPLFSFCSESLQHVAHRACMEQWFRSHQPLSSNCPLCRARLSTQPASRIMTLWRLVRSPAFLRLLLARLGLASALALVAMFVRFYWRWRRRRLPGHVGAA